MNQKFGLFTPYTLKFHADYYMESSRNFLKRSFILFDEMAYITPRIKDEGYLNKLIIDSSKTRKEVLTYFKPINEFVDQDFISEISFTIRPESNMWYGPNSKHFFKFIKSYVKDKFDFDPENYKTKNEFEILDYYVTALSADVNFLFQISRKVPEISALYTELHRDAYFATYSERTSVPERILKSITNVNYFDFANLTWAQLLELRQSQFLEDFRKKISEWIGEFDLASNPLSFEQKIDKYIKESNFDFLQQNRPLTRLNILSAIIENVPTVVPNPLAVYNTLSRTMADFETEKEFGWLFFIQEAYRKNKNSA